MAERHDTHDRHERSHRDHELIGSDRNFGLVFSVFCAIVACFQLWHEGRYFLHWTVAAGLFALLSLVAPRALHPLNILWFRFGLLLHHIVSPIVLGLMFFAVFTPIALWMKLIRKRPLNLDFDRRADSYWIVRKPPGPPPGSFNNQF